MTTPASPSPDADAHKGAIEQESREENTNTSLYGQMQHRNKNPLADTLDSDFPEPGMNPEHTGQRTGPDFQGSRQLNPNPQHETREVAQRESHEREPERTDQQGRDINPETEQQDQDPGQRQKCNQGDKKDDPLAA